MVHTSAFMPIGAQPSERSNAGFAYAWLGRGCKPLPNKGFHSQSDFLIALEFKLSSFLAPNHPNIDVAISLEDQLLWEGKFDMNERIKTLVLNIPSTACEENDKIKMLFNINNPASPAELGISRDVRTLGIGLLQLRYLL